MNKKTITYTALTIACIGILVLGFFVLFEKVEEEITTPESREARKNRFLAAERFLSLSGVETHSITRRDILVNLPPENELIFINRMGGNLPPEREDSLIAWIERGGSLIITHNSFWNDSTETSRNSFLDRFGIRLMNPYGQEEHSDESPDEPDGTSTETPDPCSEDVVEQVTAGFSNGDIAELEFSTLRILEDADDTASEIFYGDTGAHIIVKHVGEGTLTVLSDNTFLKNGFIGKNDHAYWLLKQAETHSKVWILYTTIMPSFLSVILNAAPQFVITLVIFVIGFILMITMKIGPVYRVRDYSSRNIMEHLLSSGHFIRKHDKDNSRINTLRSAIKKNISSKHLYFQRKSEEQQYTLISKWVQVPAEEIRHAFRSDIQTTDDYLRVTRLLQRINTELFVNTKTAEND